MTRAQRNLHDAIRDVDTRLLVSGERLARYRVSGTPDSVRVQRAVIDRQLDERLVLMDLRDSTP